MSFRSLDWERGLFPVSLKTKKATTRVPEALGFSKEEIHWGVWDGEMGHGGKFQLFFRPSPKRVQVASKKPHPCPNELLNIFLESTFGKDGGGTPNVGTKTAVSWNPKVGSNPKWTPQSGSSNPKVVRVGQPKLFELVKTFPSKVGQLEQLFDFEEPFLSRLTQFWPDTCLFFPRSEKYGRTMGQNPVIYFRYFNHTKER